MGRHEFNAYRALCTQAQTRAEWADVLSKPAPKRAPCKPAKTRGFIARFFALITTF